MPQARTPEQALHDAAAAMTRGQFTQAGDIIDQALAQTPCSPETAAELLLLRGVAASEAGGTALPPQAGRGAWTTGERGLSARPHTGPHPLATSTDHLRRPGRQPPA